MKVSPWLILSIVNKGYVEHMTLSVFSRRFGLGGELCNAVLYLKSEHILFCQCLGGAMPAIPQRVCDLSDPSYVGWEQ